MFSILEGEIDGMKTLTRKLLNGGLASVLLFTMCVVPSMAEAPSAPDEPMVAEVQAVPEQTAIPETQLAPAPSASADEHQRNDEHDDTLLNQLENDGQVETLPYNEETEPDQVGEIEVIEEDPVPLAGGLAPSVVIRANRDIGNLRIGDELVLTAELNGFQGLKCAIRWQARKDGQWQDLKGQDSTRLTIRITEENASWAYRVAVDATPAR